MTDILPDARIAEMAQHVNCDRLTLTDEKANQLLDSHRALAAKLKEATDEIKRLKGPMSLGDIYCRRVGLQRCPSCFVVNKLGETCKSCGRQPAPIEIIQAENRDLLDRAKAATARERRLREWHDGPPPGLGDYRLRDKKGRVFVVTVIARHEDCFDIAWPYREWCRYDFIVAHQSLADAPAAQPSEAERHVELKHGMNCPAYPGSDDACTCGLEWRIKLQTENEMHAAWRKRAEEAERELQVAQQTIEEQDKCLENMEQTLLDNRDLKAEAERLRGVLEEIRGPLDDLTIGPTQTYEAIDAILTREGA
jgi:hypothetical protein